MKSEFFSTRASIGRSLLLWGAKCASGKTELKLIKRRMSASVFINMLRYVQLNDKEQRFRGSKLDCSTGKDTYLQFKNN